MLDVGFIMSLKLSLALRCVYNGGGGTTGQPAAMAGGTMTVIAATTTTATAVSTEEAATAASETKECSGGGGHREVHRDEPGIRGLSEKCKAIWQFHPPARRHVFDAVLKHG